MDDPQKSQSSLERALAYESRPEINTEAFAGRLGGYQRFTTAASDSADAEAAASWRSLLSLDGFRNPQLWKLALIEGVGTGMQVFLSGMLAVGLVPTAAETSVGAVFPVTYAALVQIALIALFIYATGSLTGGHFNPLITFGTFTAGLSSLPRTVLYVLFQCIGSVVGAFMMRGGLGATPEQLQIIPGCYVDPSQVTPGQAYLLETVFAFITIFLAFGLGLDPRNATSFGPSLAPILIALSSALALFSGGIAKPGYLGASNNPARCLGLMAAAEDFTYHYVHWTGVITATVANGLLYFLVPPYKK